MKQQASKSYNNMIYSSGPIKTSDYISNIPNLIHQQLYSDALNKLKEEHTEINWNNVKIIENPQDEYWKFSYIQVIDYVNRTNTSFSLEPYWNNIILDKNIYKESQLPNIKEINNINEYYEIEYIDYIHGKVKMRNKIDGNIRYMDFSNLNGYEQLSDSFDIYNTTFTYLYKRDK